MTMNSPKIFIAAFCFVTLILVALLAFKPKTEHTLINGVVVSQTLTQSLDGHRKFINIVISDNQELLIQADPKTDCPKGSNITVKQESGLISGIDSHQLVKCIPSR